MRRQVMDFFQKSMTNKIGTALMRGQVMDFLWKSMTNNTSHYKILNITAGDIAAA